MSNPSQYKPEYVDLARNYCLLGATDEDLAKFFDVSTSTISNWKVAHPEFKQALIEGRDYADANVASRLYNRAMGYTHPDTHISSYQGIVTETPITKHYPPDTVAAIFWLKNRQRHKWRDKIETEITDSRDMAQRIIEARRRAQNAQRIAENGSQAEIEEAIRQTTDALAGVNLDDLA